MSYITTASWKQAITYTFTWHALSDACPKCRQLNGREWSDQDLFQDVLWDHIWGNIWDLNEDRTLAHPHCRCQVEVKALIDWSQVPEVQEYKSIMEKIPEVHMEFLVEEVTDVSQIAAMRSSLADLKAEMMGFSMSYTQLRDVEIIINRMLLTLERSTGSKEIQEVINELQRVAMIVRGLQIALISLEALEDTTGVGWVLKVLKVGTGLTIAGMNIYAATRGG